MGCLSFQNDIALSDCLDFKGGRGLILLLIEEEEDFRFGH